MNESHQQTSYSTSILCFLEIFQVSGSDKTPFPEVTKLRFFIYKVPFILHQLVELFHNSTNAKEQKKIGQVKKERQN